MTHAAGQSGGGRVPATAEAAARARGPGAVQMAIDDGLLDEALFVTARRYVWTPPALSLGKFQRLSGDRLGRPPAVRRACGGRPAAGRCCTATASSGRSPWCSRPARCPATASTTPTRWSRPRWPRPSAPPGCELDGGRERPYRSSALCFASGLRHDLLAGAARWPPSPRCAEAGPRWCTAACSSAARPTISWPPRAAARGAVAGRRAGRRARPPRRRPTPRRTFAEAVWAGFVQGLAEALRPRAPSVGPLALAARR